MHEIEMALELIKAVDKAAKECQGRRVSVVKVKLGKARGVNALSLKAAFDWIKPDTVARETELQIEEIPIFVHCSLCDASFNSEDVMPTCPSCGAMGGEVLMGDEFLVMGVEIGSPSLSTRAV
ncbi:MAG: hydrogenase maturation nickel metallochaperone HypA [Acidobacteria bacterium]|nr:hydrogenase maturation nickel metallochaperone HypA [Acidobacteriota bacterium]